MAKEKNDKVIVTPDVEELPKVETKKTEQKKNETVIRYELETVATQTADIIVDKVTGKEVLPNDLLVRIANDLQELKEKLL